MQSLSNATTASTSAERCAKQLIETVPLVMQFMRREMRLASTQELSVAQLRTLNYIRNHEHPSLSSAADFIGLSLPAMSRLVDALVRKELASRKACPNDRRHVRLGVTPAGHAALDEAWGGTRDRLTEEIGAMTAEQCTKISTSMEILRATFDPDVVGD